MTEREFEQRLRGFYQLEVEAAGRVPAELREKVWSIPDRMPGKAGLFQSRRAVVLFAAAMLTALLVGGAIAIGAGLIRMPWEREDSPTIIARPGGWVAYVVALTDWNTPGGPTFETPGSPTRIALVRDGESIPIYIGGAAPPEPGAPTDEWLSVRQQCPKFSPDGLWLAYVEAEPARSSVGGDRAELVIARVDDLALAVEIEFRIPAMHVGECPVWSPDGTQIAFVRRGGETMAIADLEGTTHDLAVPDRVAQIASYAWSPDGRSIAIIDLSIPLDSSPHGRLWLVPLDEREARLLYEPRTPIGAAPSWSADGSRIAITTAFGPESPDLGPFNASYGSDWMVRVVDVDSGEAQDIGRGYGPSWAPMGAQLAYLANPARGGQNAETGTVVVVDMAPGNEWVIPAAPIPPGTPLSDYNMRGGTGYWQPHEPHWSPDGASLLFIGSDGVWGTSVLLEASATGDQIPAAVSETWVAEWYADNPFSWQADVP